MAPDETARSGDKRTGARVWLQLEAVGAPVLPTLAGERRARALMQSDGRDETRIAAEGYQVDTLSGVSMVSV